MLVRKEQGQRQTKGTSIQIYETVTEMARCWWDVWPVPHETQEGIVRPSESSESADSEQRSITQIVILERCVLYFSCGLIVAGCAQVVGAAQAKRARESL